MNAKRWDAESKKEERKESEASHKYPTRQKASQYENLLAKYKFYPVPTNGE